MYSSSVCTTIFKQIDLIPTSLSIDGYVNFFKQCRQILLHCAFIFKEIHDDSVNI